MYNHGHATLTPSPANWVPQDYTVHAYIIMSDYQIPFGRRTKAFYGFIATKNDGTESIIAMRGTQGSTAWIDEILGSGFIKFVVDGQHLGDVERGFGTIYGSIDVYSPASGPFTTKQSDSRTFAQKIAAAIEIHRSSMASAAAKAAPMKIIAAGHSLGAALLTQYVLENETRRKIDQVTAYTFGSPRVGDPTFVKNYNAQLNAKTWRIFIKEDWAPNLPPDIFGFAHVGGDGVEFSVEGLGVRANLGCHHAIETYMYVLEPQYPYALGECRSTRGPVRGEE